MSSTWKKTLATSAILVVATWGAPDASEAAGRISERLTSARSSSAKEKTAAQETEDGDRSSGGLRGKRATSSSRLASRTAKRKEVPDHAKEALNSTGGLDIDLGDMVETLEGPDLTPPSVPPTDEEVLLNPATTKDHSRSPRDSRRPSVLSKPVDQGTLIRADRR